MALLRSLDASFERVVSGRTASSRRIAMVLERVRRADRLDLVEHLLASGPKIADRVLAAALGSPNRNVQRKNEIRREVFVRFVARSESPSCLEVLSSYLARRHMNDATCRELVARRLAERTRSGPAGQEPVRRLQELAAESEASTTLQSLLAVAVELDLLALEAANRYGGELDRTVGYRLRRAQATIVERLARLGVVEFARPGEEVPFDARRHEYVGLALSVAAGMPVHVVTRGYTRSQNGARPDAVTGPVLCKAQVE
ncbi:MAG: hypothetical protein HY720_05675 [Planctomycetes bacterium]|nr:hypothetical protein [Planctomycetota bacterium]